MNREMYCLGWWPRCATKFWKVVKCAVPWVLRSTVLERHTWPSF